MKQKNWFGGGMECWTMLAIAASILLPWYGVQDDFNWLRDFDAIFRDDGSANGWLQAAAFQRPWLFLPLVAPLVALGTLFFRARRAQGFILLGSVVGATMACSCTRHMPLTERPMTLKRLLTRLMAMAWRLFWTSCLTTSARKGIICPCCHQTSSIKTG